MLYTTEELARMWRNVGNHDIAGAYEALGEAERKLSEINALADNKERSSDEILADVKKVLDS